MRGPPLDEFVAVACRNGTAPRSQIEEMLAGCRTLYSEDFQHGQTFDGLTIVNPFR